VPGPANAGAAGGDWGGGATLANYSLTAGIDNVPQSQAHPATDFFGNPRPSSGNFDPGAVEYAGGGGGGGCSVSVSPSTLAFGSQNDGTTSATQNLTLHNGCTSGASGGSFTFGGGTPEPFSRVTTGTFPGGAPNCGGTLAAGASCTIKVAFAPPNAATSVAFNRTLTVAYGGGVAVTGSPVALTGTGAPVGTLRFTAASNGTLGTVFGIEALDFKIPTPRAAVTSAITVTNGGPGPLAITAVTVPMNGGGRFSITGDTCLAASPLPANGTCTISVQYATPTARPGFPIMGLLSVVNDGSNAAGGESPLILLAQ